MFGHGRPRRCGHPRESRDTRRGAWIVYEDHPAVGRREQARVAFEVSRERPGNCLARRADAKRASGARRNPLHVCDRAEGLADAPRRAARVHTVTAAQVGGEGDGSDDAFVRVEEVPDGTGVVDNGFFVSSHDETSLSHLRGSKLQSRVSEPAPSTPALARRRVLRDRVADEIVAAAARLTSTGGEGVSMSDIAGAAGVARATLYRYFPSRQALNDRLRDAAVGEIRTRLDAARIDEVEPLDGLTRTVRTFVEVGHPFIVAARERRTVGDFDVAVVQPLCTLIESGQSAGLLRGDIPAPWLAESLLGLCTAMIAAGTLGREDLIASIIGLYLDGARALQGGVHEVSRSSRAATGHS